MRAALFLVEIRADIGVDDDRVRGHITGVFAVFVTPLHEEQLAPLVVAEELEMRVTAEAIAQHPEPVDLARGQTDGTQILDRASDRCCRLLRGLRGLHRLSHLRIPYPERNRNDMFEGAVAGWQGGLGSVVTQCSVDQPCLFITNLNTIPYISIPVAAAPMTVRGDRARLAQHYLPATHPGNREGIR